MKIGSAYPSKWLKSTDIGKRKLKLTIDNIEMETVGDEDKLVMYFTGKDKGMILNRTNAGMCEMGFGSDDTDDWIGKEVILSTAPVSFKGKIVQGLKLDPVVPEPEAGAEPDADEPPF